jgi:hypothetical protein
MEKASTTRSYYNPPFPIVELKNYTQRAAKKTGSSAHDMTSEAVLITGVACR